LVNFTYPITLVNIYTKRLTDGVTQGVTRGAERCGEYTVSFIQQQQRAICFRKAVEKYLLILL